MLLFSGRSRLGPSFFDLSPFGYVCGSGGSRTQSQRVILPISPSGLLAATDSRRFVASVTNARTWAVLWATSAGFNVSVFVWQWRARGRICAAWRGYWLLRSDFHFYVPYLFIQLFFHLLEAFHGGGFAGPLLYEQDDWCHSAFCGQWYFMDHFSGVTGVETVCDVFVEILAHHFPTDHIK